MSRPATCNTCVRPVNAPWRVWNPRGQVIQGCVDACHGGHLVTSESRRWHERPEAKKIRAALKRMLEKGGHV